MSLPMLLMKSTDAQNIVSFLYLEAALFFFTSRPGSLKSYKPSETSKQTLRNIFNVAEENICIAVPPSIPLPAAK